MQVLEACSAVICRATNPNLHKSLNGEERSPQHSYDQKCLDASYLNSEN